ncbi:MAG: hypothetical protein GX587_11425 [Bacteroidales bacterium]|mgnify:CR=1 FL=1|nr:hypothetical protein [Bacteroidales bacterium]
MSEMRILGIFIHDRNKEAGKVQGVLTKYGCSIKTRLGLHEVSDDFCASSGLILLELVGDKNECTRLENDLLGIDGIQVKKMYFNE